MQNIQPEQGRYSLTSLVVALAASGSVLFLQANTAYSVDAPAAQPEAATTSDTIAHTIFAAITGQKTISVDGVRFDTEEYKGIYSAMEYQPFWVSENGLTQRATDALKVISRSDQQGLNPKNYGLETIESLSQTISHSGTSDPKTLATLDLLISHAVTRYMSDMRYGAMKPQRKMLSHFETGSPDTMKLLTIAATSNNMNEAIAAQAPASPEYKALQTLLTRYREIADNGGWELFPAGKTIRIGASDKRIPTLRRILATMGDYQMQPAHAQSTVYDTELVEAVKRFQERHGLNVEGTIGTNTQKSLAVPVENRISQIIVNLERMRWMPTDLGAKHVLVNVPGFTLYGYDQGKQVLTMRVIVGAPKTKTPIFSNVITDVLFNPSWGAPQSIIRKELLPKLRSNPEYFVNAGFTVYHNGEAVDPHSIDPDSGGSFSFRQRPGAHNALGKIKFNLPDNDDIYMHSTAKPALFKSEMRALSHGCIRLEDPRAMAKFVLGDEDGWDEDKIDRAYDSSATRNVDVTPVPVHLVYWTAWADENGTAHFYEDVYKRDGGVNSAQTKTKNLKLAENN